jgi:NAD(P)-dependent dehydrogenase (short-subunit alcohol dehydrogenase family)
MLGDRNAKGADDAAARIARDHAATAHAGALDVSNPRSVASFADKAVAALGGIDIWINNAGIYYGHSLIETDDAEWQAMNDVNLRGTFLGCREAARRMIAAGDRPGRVIVNIASVAGVRGRVSLGAYSAAKAGVIGLTRSAAVELAAHGIRVLCVTPSMAETPGVQEMRAAAAKQDATGNTLAAMEASVLASFPMGRTAQADEVARVVFFCATDLAAFMTGTNVVVDGGLTAR